MLSIHARTFALAALVMLFFNACFAAPAAAPAAAAAIQYKDVILFHHNIHRANHSVPALTWDPVMAANAKLWAQKCDFSHNVVIGSNGPYGQNLMAGVPRPETAKAVSDYWYNAEMTKFHWYGQANPDFSTFGSYGHFSQVVWKNTKKVGCYTQHCPNGLKGISGNIKPVITVCDYSPPGNYGGEWATNVLKPLGHPTVHG